MASYQPIWAPPQQTDFSGHQVHTVGVPDWGGTALVLALNLLSEAQLADPTTDPEALYWLIQMARQSAGLPRSELPATSVTNPDYARAPVGPDASSWALSSRAKWARSPITSASCVTYGLGVHENASPQILV